MVTSDSVICLGVYDDYQWFSKELKTQKQSRKEITNDSLHRKHISEKETGRWIEGYKKATELASSCPDTQIISVSDREGDWICPYISRHLLSLNPLQARCRRYSRGER